MIERVLEQANAIKRALDDRKHQHLNLTWQDIAVLELINAALKPVAEFTDVLSNEKVVTASSVRPVLRLLTNDLLNPSPEDSELTNSFAFIYLYTLCKIDDIFLSIYKNRYIVSISR